MRRDRRIVVVAIFTTFLVGCSGAAKHEAARGSSPVVAHPLAVRADGVIDPDKIDLSGLPGVTHAEQVRAENLLRSTILAVQKFGWTDVEKAKADGFVSIGDGFNPGNEHFVHWDWINDKDIFDPNHPESLVYYIEPDGRHILEAAMYILPDRYTLYNAPDIGGKLTQYHEHGLICFDNSPIPAFRRINLRATVAALRTPRHTCVPPHVRLLTTPMLHVWIRPNPCGPFASIGETNTVRADEHVACDSAHGSKTDF